MERRFAWEHHRDGWARVERLVQEHFTCPDGVLFISAVEDQLFLVAPIEEAWVGIVHQVPHHDLPGFPDLERFLALEAWHASEPHCLGLWTLADYVRQFLIDSGVRVPVSVLPYPSGRDVPMFEWRRFAGRERPRLLHVGEFLRDYQAFFDLDVPSWQKQLNEPADWALWSDKLRMNDSVEVVPAVGNAEYDQLLAESVVFQQLRDAPANTVIVECLARGTPVCVNRIGGVEEYLGADYPLYHDGDASSVLRDPERVHAAHRFLLERRERIGADEHFLERVENSAIYRALPVPPSLQGEFRRFDVTVLIAVYARLHNLRAQLDRFVEQDDAPSFEIILWNNDPNNASAVDDIVSALTSDLTIRVIHCSANVYCSMRWAVPAIARSETLLICDDDVLPEPGYVRTLFDAHRRLGPDVAVCLRGHVFQPHRLDLDDPGRVWRREEHLTFHDQAAQERVIDFAHADNLVISTELVRRASLYPMTHPEYVLVDDYWLSYVLSAHLGATCRKIQAPNVFSFTSCADDPDIALYQNPDVREQRVRLYVEHMQAGWPESAQLSTVESASVTRSESSSVRSANDGR
jgi:hypothetical protein